MFNIKKAANMFKNGAKHWSGRFLVGFYSGELCEMSGLRFCLYSLQAKKVLVWALVRA